jgi:hypothetical protein
LKEGKTFWGVVLAADNHADVSTQALTVPVDQQKLPSF